MTEPAPRLLFRPGARTPQAPVPPWAADLRLDELAPLLGAGETGVRRLEVLLAPLPDADAVAYRQEVFRDLEAAPLAAALRQFVAVLDEVRATLDRAQRMRQPAERDWWRLHALERHDSAVLALVDALLAAAPTSRGLRAVLAHLQALVASGPFTTRRAAVATARAALGGVAFRLRVGEQRVVVSPVRDEPDLEAEIRDTFARVRDGDPMPLPVDVFTTLDMNPLEAEVLARVVRLVPEPFARLAAVAAAHPDAVDRSLVLIADDVGWYLAMHDVLAPLRDVGLPVCYPEIAADGRLVVAGTADLLVARRLAEDGRPAALSDLDLAPGERVVIVTGPSQGGRTSFARALGQLHVLAAAGCPVPAASARVPLVDAVATVFDRMERLDDPGGRLRTELRRIRPLLERAGPSTLVIANEPFASTTASDALSLARRLFAALADRGARVVAVTFLEELAADAGAVSVAAMIDGEDPAARTCRFERRPADGLAHAQRLAERHGLGAASVEARLRR